MSLLDKVLGRPLASWEAGKQELSVTTGVPVLGLDALASTAYGPEAALTILGPLGVLGFRYFPIVVLLVVAELIALYLSYRQTIAVYPNGGGAYIVAKSNLGARAGVWAAVALLLDYILNVAVGISAGIGALVSAIPALHPYTLMLCLIVLAMLTVVNLRGVRESGLAFVVPVFAFVACLGAAMGIGLVRAWLNGGHPQPIEAPPAVPQAHATVSTWLILIAFANGLTALTGVEAVSNAVPLFRQPTVPNARRTLTLIVVILALFLLCLGYLCPAYHIGAMNQRQPGYQTILSQLVGAVTGRGAFYYVAIANIFIVLTYSAQTSFTDFPRVCRLLAEDRFLPKAFANRGRRLVFSAGILVLAILSGLILIAFRGITDKLIPLFAVGAFCAFLFSQAGMVVHWLREPGGGNRTALAYNGIGAAATAVALAIIIVAKFIEGAWIVVIAAPALVFLLERIHRHYTRIAQEVEKPMPLAASDLQPPAVIIPIEGWNRVTEKALRLASLLSDDITAVHVSTEEDDPQQLKKLWAEKVEEPAKAADRVVPRLEIIPSPYRWIDQPILDFVNRTRKDKPDRLIAVIIPELVEPHWYEYLLHNLHAAGLRTRLFLERDQRMLVISTPWYLHEA